MQLRNGKCTAKALNVQTYLHNKKDITDDISEMTDNPSENLDDISEYIDDVSENSDDVSEYVPTESIYSVGNSSSDFTKELMSLLNTLKETDDISLRLDTILDIYTYLDNHIIECKNESKNERGFTIFITTVRKKTLDLYNELAVTAMKHGKELQDILLLVSIKVISVLAKIGE